MQPEFNPQSKLCLICNSANLKHFDAVASDTESSVNVHIKECKECSFAWQHPFGRSEQESVDHFHFNYKMQGNRTSKYFDPAVKKSIALLEYDFLSELLVAGNHLLDVGAGAGIFAAIAAERGYAVTAIDPALENEQIGANADITGICGTLKDLPNGKLFDVITMWDVIEHVTAPVETIAMAGDHLKEGGWVVLETGNYKSADRVVGGRKHWIYQLDHRWYFSPESLAHILRQLGFSEIILSQKTLRPNWKGNANYCGPSRTQLLKSIIKNPLKGASSISTFIELKKATKWPYSGIGIFAMAARK